MNLISIIQNQIASNSIGVSIFCFFSCNLIIFKFKTFHIRSYNQIYQIVQQIESWNDSGRTQLKTVFFFVFDLKLGNMFKFDKGPLDHTSLNQKAPCGFKCSDVVIFFFQQKFKFAKKVYLCKNKITKFTCPLVMNFPFDSFKSSLSMM